MQKQTTISGNSSTKDYLGNLELNNGKLQAANHSEGRYVEEDNQWEYNIKDHLGNIRVVFVEDNTGMLDIVQENHYYPFGMQMNGNWHKQQTVKNDYLYNGKELNTEIGLNWSYFGFRFYDATIIRFTGVVPISEDWAHLSTYNYAGNSPITNIDWWGLQPVSVVERQIETNNTDYLKGNKSKAEFFETNKAIGKGGLVGLSIFVPDISDVIIAGLIAKAVGFFSKAKKVATAASKADILKANKAAGKEGEEIVTKQLQEEFPNDKVLEQVTGKFNDGTTTKFDNVVIDPKTAKPKLMNETKTGNAKLSKQQDRFHEQGESVTLTGNKAQNAKGRMVNSSSTETRVTRVKREALK